MARESAPTNGELRLMLKPEEAARAIGVSRSRIFPMLASGEIQSVKHGRSRLIPVEALEAWVAAKMAEQAAERVA